MASVAIIGHGKSIEGRGWGRFIDAQDFVIRLWNCEWQTDKDYGSRYDLGVFEISPKLYVRFAEALNSGKLIERLPGRGWVGSYLKGDMPKVLPPRTTLINQHVWVSIGKGLGGVGATGRLRLTRGTVAACFALDGLDRIIQGGVTRLILVGFDNVRIGQSLPIEEGFTESYIRSFGVFGWESYKPGESKNGNHDLEIELPLIKKLASKKGVEVLFSEDIW